MRTTRNGARNKFAFALTVFCLAFFSCGKAGVKESVPLRVICLSPSGAEILYGIGAEEKIVARTDFCNFPKEISALPSVGGFDGNSISVEKILSFSPDFVYGAEGVHDGIFATLGSLGIKTYAGKGGRGIESTLEEILQVSEILGKKQNGDRLVREIREKIQSVPQSVPLQKAYYEVWSEPFISVGKNSFIGDILEKAGFENVFCEIETGYPLVSEESIIAKMPDVIFVPDSNGISSDTMKNRAGWVQIPAVKNGRIFFVDADLLSRPGPRIGDAVVFLNSFLQSDSL